MSIETVSPAQRIAFAREYLGQLRRVRPRVASAATLAEDWEVRSTVMFGLLRVTQASADVAGELAAGGRLAPELESELLQRLRVLPVIADLSVTRAEELLARKEELAVACLWLDFERAAAALDHLDEIDDFLRIMEAQDE
jgi:hypothetical protein